MVESTKALVAEIQGQLKTCIDQFDQVIQDSSYHYDKELEKLQKFEESIDQMQKVLKAKDNNNKMATEHLKTLI